MEQIRTGVSAQESSFHPRPAAATVADVMRPPPTTVQQHDHAAAAAIPLCAATAARSTCSRNTPYGGSGASSI